MKNTLFLRTALGLMLAAMIPSALPAQETKVDNTPILGSWAVEVGADTETFYLTLDLKETDGTLEGKISEVYGTFTDVIVSALAFDGANLKFEFTSPTPPDGLERLIQTEFKLANGVLEGTMTVPDLTMTVQVKATKK